MKKVRLVYRLFCFLSAVFIFLSFGIGIRCIIKNKIIRQKKISSLLRFLSAKMIRIIGCSLKVEGLEYLQSKQNYLIVANHVSYLDITLLYSFIDKNRFISHLELKENNPFLSLMIKVGGSYFIERRNLKYIRKELREATTILKQGLSLIFFPEGTSTDGSEIKPFHPLFFGTATQAKKPVLPVCINYKKVDGSAFNLKNRDLICWYDDETSFAQHLFSLLSLKSIEVELLFLPPIDSKGKTSRFLAEESQRQIQKHYTPPQASLLGENDLT